MGRRVEIDKIGGLDVHRADAEAHGAGVEAVDVHQALKRRLQRSDVIEAEPVGIWRRPERGRERTGREQMRRAEHHDAQRASSRSAPPAIPVIFRLINGRTMAIAFLLRGMLS